MTKKKKVTKVKKTVKKPLKVVIEEPVVDQGKFELKRELPIEEPTLLPADPTPEPTVNPNDPVDTHITEGYKRPSITNVHEVHTKKQFESLVDAYWKNNPDMKEKNPAKYHRKKSELERKLKELK